MGVPAKRIPLPELCGWEDWMPPAQMVPVGREPFFNMAQSISARNISLERGALFQSMVPSLAMELSPRSSTEILEKVVGEGTSVLNAFNGYGNGLSFILADDDRQT